MATAEILSVGTELLFGLTQDTNATELSRFFRELGFTLCHRQTCGDDREDLKNALRLALSRSDVVLVTGGLGPTYDDVTRDAVSAVTGRELIFHEETAARIRAFFQRRGRRMKENNLLQALVPKDAQVLPNDWGTAPGIWLEIEGKLLILLPGVPREMRALFRERVAPKLASRSGRVSFSRILHLFGITESELDASIPARWRDSVDPSVAPFAGNGEVEVHLTSFRQSLEEAEAAVRQAADDLLCELAPFCYGEGEDSLEKVLVQRFAAAGLTLATAESCTGGLLSKRLTDVPGSSSVIELGVAAYSERIKGKLLYVPAEVFDRSGVYSEECALAMARGVRDLAGSDFGIGITGIAGPDGGTEKDPVGTVYIAVCGPEKWETKRFVFGHGGGERGFIRHLAASHALAMTLQQAELFALPHLSGGEK